MRGLSLSAPKFTGARLRKTSISDRLRGDGARANFDGEFFFRQKKNAVIANAKAELVTRGLEFFPVARASGEVAVDSVHDAQCGLAVDGTKIGASSWRPENSFFGHGRA